MRLDDENPLFRKVVPPWYDSNWLCWIVLIAMAVMVLFSWAGIVVACSRPEYHAHTWMPVLLLVLSLLVGGSVVYRLVHRHYLKKLQFREP